MGIANRQPIVDQIRNLDKFRHGTNLRGATDAEWWCAYCKRPQSMYRVFSYETIIGQKCVGCGHVWVNATKYTSTTNQHQSMVRWAWDIDHIPEEQITVKRPKYRGDVSLSCGEHQDDRDYLTHRDYTIMWSMLSFMAPDLSPTEDVQPGEIVMFRYIRVTPKAEHGNAIPKAMGSKGALFHFFRTEGWDENTIELAQTLWDRFAEAYDATHPEAAL